MEVFGCSPYGAITPNAVFLLLCSPCLLLQSVLATGEEGVCSSMNCSEVWFVCVSVVCLCCANLSASGSLQLHKQSLTCQGGLTLRKNRQKQRPSLKTSQNVSLLLKYPLPMHIWSDRAPSACALSAKCTAQCFNLLGLLSIPHPKVKFCNLEDMNLNFPLLNGPVALSQHVCSS